MGAIPASSNVAQHWMTTLLMTPTNKKRLDWPMRVRDIDQQRPTSSSSNCSNNATNDDDNRSAEAADRKKNAVQQTSKSGPNEARATSSAQEVALSSSQEVTRSAKTRGKKSQNRWQQAPHSAFKNYLQAGAHTSGSP